MPGRMTITNPISVVAGAGVLRALFISVTGDFTFLVTSFYCFFSLGIELWARPSLEKRKTLSTPPPQQGPEICVS